MFAELFLASNGACGTSAISRLRNPDEKRHNAPLEYSRLRAQTEIMPPDGGKLNLVIISYMAEEKRYTPSVSLKESEKKYLEARAKKAGVSYTRYMREVALGDLPQDDADFSKYDYVAVLKKLTNEINAVGKNLNQVARVANTAGTINIERLEKLEDELFELKMEIMESIL